MDVWLKAVFPFMWIVLRTTGLFITAPVIGTKYIPWSVKVTMSLIMGYLLWLIIPVAPSPHSIGGFVVAAAGEIVLGLLLGFCGSVMMAAIETAGHIADMEIGFGMANVIDPQYGQPSPILGIFKYLLMILVFLGIDGHHLFIKALFKSFEIVPAGAATIPAAWPQIGLGAASSMLKTALILSCPVWASALIVDFALGAIARTVPQMNMFVVGIPIKTLVGLGIMSASIVFYGVFTEEITLSMEHLLESLLGAMSK
ncbi:MAG: flagellar biosynthetic protein FliR [Bacillota bacterium]